MPFPLICERTHREGHATSLLRLMGPQTIFPREGPALWWIPTMAAFFPWLGDIKSPRAPVHPACRRVSSLFHQFCWGCLWSRGIGTGCHMPPITGWTLVHPRISHDLHPSP